MIKEIFVILTMVQGIIGYLQNNSLIIKNISNNNQYVLTRDKSVIDFAYFNDYVVVLEKHNVASSCLNMNSKIDILKLYTFNSESFETTSKIIEQGGSEIRFIVSDSKKLLMVVKCSEDHKEMKFMIYDENLNVVGLKTLKFEHPMYTFLYSFSGEYIIYENSDGLFRLNVNTGIIENINKPRNLVIKKIYDIGEDLFSICFDSKTKESFVVDVKNDFSVRKVIPGANTDVYITKSKKILMTKQNIVSLGEEIEAKYEITLEDFSGNIMHTMLINNLGGLNKIGIELLDADKIILYSPYAFKAKERQYNKGFYSVDLKTGGLINIWEDVNIDYIDYTPFKYIYKK